MFILYNITIKKSFGNFETIIGTEFLYKTKSIYNLDKYIRDNIINTKVNKINHYKNFPFTYIKHEILDYFDVGFYNGQVKTILRNTKIKDTEDMKYYNTENYLYEYEVMNNEVRLKKLGNILEEDDI